MTQGWVTRWRAVAGLVVLAMALSGLAVAVASAVWAADGTITVVNARLGLHPDKTRFVLEVSDRLTFRATVESDPYRVVVDLPDLIWSGGDGWRPGQGLIRTYRLERPGAAGARLILDVAGPVRIGTAMVLEPSEGHQVRLVLDIVSATPEVFRQERERVRGSRPAPEGVAVPAPKAASADSFLPSPSPSASASALSPFSAPLVPTPPQAQPQSQPQAQPQLQPQAQPQPESHPSVAARSAMVPGSLRPAAAASSRPVSLTPLITPAVVADRAGPRPEPPPLSEAATPPPAPSQPQAQLVAAVARPPVPPTVPPKPRRVGPPAKPMIALDPGHGGVDPGATGINAIHEKDITLATAREVKRQLEATGRFRVMLTRDADEFVPLRERVAAARQAGADLFISLHADSIGKAEIRGLSIYTQSDKGSDHEAETLAAKENRADAIGGIDLSRENDQVATILIDLAQRDTRNHSRRFATMVLREAAHAMRLLPKPDRAAAFAVLTAPDVPSVLIEMGYLSSPDDASLLIQPQHRQRLAATLVRAIEGYFNWLSGGHRS